MTALRAAIYARKSTEDRTAESTTRQIEHAQQYSALKGWVVAPEHIYRDESKSGAELVKRADYQRLLLAVAGARPPFDVLVMADQDRFGRAGARSTAHLQDVLESGVRIFEYLNDREVKLETPEDEFMLYAKGFSAKSERTNAMRRTLDGLKVRVDRGLNAGGRVYGYDNVWKLPDGTERISRPNERKPFKEVTTHWRVNDEQADVVGRIFKMYAAGYGPRSIAKALNGDPKYAPLLRRFFGGNRPPKPVVGKRGTGSWAPTAIRGMLRNERYAGVLIYGEMTKSFRRGTKRRDKQTNLERITRADRPDLRIVTAELWDAVQKRISAERRSYLHAMNGDLHGRPETGRDSRYMLSGLVRCGGCESSMVASSQSHGSGQKRRKVRCFVCSYRSNRGATACGNRLRPREEVLNREVLAAIGEVLKPEVLRASVRRALEKHRARSKAVQDSPERMRAELKKAETERDRLVAAIRMGGGRLESLVPVLAQTEERIEALRRDTAERARPENVASLSDKQMERCLLDVAGRWQEWVGKHPTLARQALRAMLVGPIQLIPEADGYRLKGVSRLGALFEQGNATNRVAMASRRGFEPRLPP